MPRKKKEPEGSASAKSGGKAPAPPVPPEATEPEPAAEPEPPAAPEPPANAPTPEVNRPKPPARPRTRKEKEARDAKVGKVSTSTDGRRARPPMKDGKVDLKQAETWSKNPKNGLLTYRFSNGAVVREDEL